MVVVVILKVLNVCLQEAPPSPLTTTSSSRQDTTQDLRTGGFWLAESNLLWCHAADNGATIAMVIVLCLPLVK